MWTLDKYFLRTVKNFQAHEKYKSPPNMKNMQWLVLHIGIGLRQDITGT